MCIVKLLRISIKQKMSYWYSDYFCLPCKDLVNLVVFQQSSFYRPQRSWGKVMFLHVSVILFTGEGSTWAGTPLDRSSPWTGTLPGQVHSPEVHPPGQVHPLPPARARYTPWAGNPPPWEQCMLGDMGNMWAVRILLECILVPF